METLFLAKLLGLYFGLVGVIVLLRRGAIMPAISELAKNKPLILIFGFLEIFAGLAMVLAYPVVSLNWEGLLSLIGWMMLIEGVIYLATPAKEVRKFILSFNTPAWYTTGGIISILLGAYLINVGFELGLF